MIKPPSKLILHDDIMPPLQQQAEANGWMAGMFNFGKGEADNVDYFNPSIIRFPVTGKTWLLVRRAEFIDRLRFGKNSVWAFELDQKIIPARGLKLKFPATSEDEQFEDPRGVFFENRVYVSACNFIWYGARWTGAHQTLGSFKTDWRFDKRYDIPYGKNGTGMGRNSGHEKNWLWFFFDGKPHLLYNADPWTVVECDSNFLPVKEHKGPSVKWQYGTIRGGTPPVRIGNEFWTFFHSSVDWNPPFRRYHMGALCFKAEPPFTPTQLTPHPILTGSQNDVWMQRKPLVIFPGGCLFENSKWFIVGGVNDLKCFWAEIPYEDVLVLSEKI